MSRRKPKEEVPETVEELVDRFKAIQDDLAQRREAKRISMAKYRHRVRTGELIPQKAAFPKGRVDL
jgi:hypothetical protein